MELCDWCSIATFLQASQLRFFPSHLGEKLQHGICLAGVMNIENFPLIVMCRLKPNFIAGQNFVCLLWIEMGGSRQNLRIYYSCVKSDSISVKNVQQSYIHEFLKRLLR